MPPRSITILHVTDLHVDHAAPQRLAAILANRLKNNALATVSAILVGGDLLNVWHPLTDDVKYDAPATEAMRTDWAAVLFRDVAQVLRTAVGDDGTGDHRVPVLWIPGNHDPIESFDAADPDAWLTAHGVLIPPGVASVHGRSFALAPGLRVVGLGGSVPATRAGTGEQIWPGCPFSTDGELQHTIDTVIKPLIQQTDGQVLLLTHSGPSLTSTTEVQADPLTDPDQYFADNTPLHTGSNALDSFLRSKHESTHGSRIPLHLHGHTHWARGYQRVLGTTVVNPGALKNGEAALVHLKWTGDGPRNGWRVATVEMLSF